MTDSRDPLRPAFVSIVVPAMNEEGNVEAMAARVRAALAGTPVTYELIFVDDGSQDRTWDKVMTAAVLDSSVRGLRLVRNFGHQSALLAGLNAAHGEAVITMDADLQHPPELLPAMVAAWQQGSPVVLTRRRDAGEGASPMKRATSDGFYKVFSAFTGVEMRPGSSDFRLLDRAVLDQLLSFRGSHGFLRGAINWFGYPSATLDYDVGRRVSGETKYSFRRMVKFAMTAILTFTTRPLYIGIWAGAALALFAFLELGFVLVQVFRGVTLPGWASLVGISSLLFGFLFLLLGVIGLYVARIHVALQMPPIYVVANRIGRERDQAKKIEETTTTTADERQRAPPRRIAG